MPRKKQGQVKIPEKVSRRVSRTAGYLSEIFSGPPGKIFLVVTIVTLVNLVLLILLVGEILCLRDQLKTARAGTAALGEQVENLRPGWVDSSFADVQPIGLGFSLVDLKTVPVDGGVKVTGAVINGAALDHYEATFTVAFDAKRQAKFTIPTLLSGHSASFEVIVPPGDDKTIPKRIRILFVGSQVSYY